MKPVMSKDPAAQGACSRKMTNDWLFPAFFPACVMLDFLHVAMQILRGAHAKLQIMLFLAAHILPLSLTDCMDVWRFPLLNIPPSYPFSALLPSFLSLH